MCACVARDMSRGGRVSVFVCVNANNIGHSTRLTPVRGRKIALCVAVFPPRNNEIMNPGNYSLNVIHRLLLCIA